jgi:acetyl-CoA synthetase
VTSFSTATCSASAASNRARSTTAGTAIWAFVILRQETVAEADEEGEGDALVQKLHQRVAKEIGAIARPGRS